MSFLSGGIPTNEVLWLPVGFKTFLDCTWSPQCVLAVAFSVVFWALVAALPWVPPVFSGVGQYFYPTLLYYGSLLPGNDAISCDSWEYSESVLLLIARATFLCPCYIYWTKFPLGGGNYWKNFPIKLKFSWAGEMTHQLKNLSQGPEFELPKFNAR